MHRNANLKKSQSLLELKADYRYVEYRGGGGGGKERNQ